MVITISQSWKSKEMRINFLEQEIFVLKENIKHSVFFEPCVITTYKLRLKDYQMELKGIKSWVIL